MTTAKFEVDLGKSGFYSLTDLVILLGKPENIVRSELTALDVRLALRFGVEAVAESDVRKLMVSRGQTLIGASVGRQPGYSAPRLRTLMCRAIGETALDLTGMSVLTEAASGAYATTPIIAAMAGATRVHALARPTSYGPVAEVTAMIEQLAAFCGVSDRITVVEALTPEILGSADLITNSGHLRPLNAEFVDQLPGHAVIALMYEAWEFRPTDIDLRACVRRRIPVVGVNERHPAVDVFSFLGSLCVRQLNDCGLSVYRNRVAVLCDNEFAGSICRGLSAAGGDVRLFQFALALPSEDWDAVVVALRPGPKPRIGEMEAGHLAKAIPPGAALLQFWGDVDRGAVLEHGMDIWPPAAPSPGHMGILLSEIGPEPIVRLQTGGLRAAEWIIRGGVPSQDGFSQLVEPHR